MKIRFIKPFRFIGNAPDDGSDSEVPVGHIVDLENDESTRWLIDNGFAEKVKEQWPCYGDKYWYVVADGVPMPNKWEASSLDFAMKAVGNVFKTEELAQRLIDYLKAVETVRHDEGFMTRSENGSSWAICLKDDGQLDATVTTNELAGAFCFEWNDDAEASIKKHPDEWKIIVNYDWSRE